MAYPPCTTTKTPAAPRPIWHWPEKSSGEKSSRPRNSLTELLRRWFGTATGALGWRPRDFWRATPAEFFAAVDGWNRSQRGGAGSDPATSDDLRALMEEFPD